MNFLHYPVMNKEVAAVFRDAGKPLFIDCTVGEGGHSHHILTQIPGSRVIAVDLDPESIEHARANLGAFASRIRFHHGDFVHLFEEIVIPADEVGGVLVDPGISMAQLRDPDRGFSHQGEGRLDMRKDRRTPLTAEEIVNTFSEERLAGIFGQYGEVRNARQVAKRIIERRLFQPIRTSGDLRVIVENVCRWRPKKGELHPAARVFQALRIFINRELDEIDDWLRKIPGRLATGARIIFLTYHSLEDRIVKQAFRFLVQNGEIRPIAPYPAFPSGEEVLTNPPSRSAKMRAVEMA